MWKLTHLQCHVYVHKRFSIQYYKRLMLKLNFHSFCKTAQTAKVCSNKILHVIGTEMCIMESNIWIMLNSCIENTLIENTYNKIS